MVWGLGLQLGWCGNWGLGCGSEFCGWGLSVWEEGGGEVAGVGLGLWGGFLGLGVGVEMRVGLLCLLGVGCWGWRVLVGWWGEGVGCRVGVETGRGG